MPSARSKRPVVSIDAVQQARAVVRPVQDRLVYEIDVDHITPSPRNPREGLGDVDELAGSIQAFDLLQPVVVRRLGQDHYELIAGHRRFAAVQQLGRPKIAAVVRDADEDLAYLMTLVENLQRENLSAREEAAALDLLSREHGWTQQQIGEAIGKTKMHVSKRLRVFSDPVLSEMVQDERLSVSVAEELLRVPEDDRARVAQQAIDERWGKAEVRAMLDGQKSKAALPGPRPGRLAERFRAWNAELEGVEPGQLSRSARREAKRLLAALHQLVGA